VSDSAGSGGYYYGCSVISRRHRLILAAAVVAMLFTAAAEWGFAALVKPIMDRGFVQPDTEFIRRLPWYLAGVLVLRAAAGFVSTYLMAWIGRRVVFDLRSDVFARMIRLPAQTFDTQPSATLVSKLIYDVDQVASSTTGADLAGQTC
jgi:subfamily B ATP-binding cassette protein MsbA